jgi:hypothetical protein
MRNSVSNTKKIKSDAGMANQYIDSHQKSGLNVADNIVKADDLKLENEIKRINNLIKIL